MPEDVPRDPFADDPDDPSSAMGGFDDAEPLTAAERDEAITDLADVEVFRSLLEPQGVLGLALALGGGNWSRSAAASTI